MLRTSSLCLSECCAVRHIVRLCSEVEGQTSECEAIVERHWRGGNGARRQTCSCVVLSVHRSLACPGLELSSGARGERPAGRRPTVTRLYRAVRIAIKLLPDDNWKCQGLLLVTSSSVIHNSSEWTLKLVKVIGFIVTLSGLNRKRHSMKSIPQRWTCNTDWGHLHATRARGAVLCTSMTADIGKPLIRSWWLVDLAS